MNVVRVAHYEVAAQLVVILVAAFREQRALPWQPLHRVGWRLGPLLAVTVTASALAPAFLPL